MYIKLSPCILSIYNLCAPNIGAPKYLKTILGDFKKDIHSTTIIVGDFNTPLSKMGRSSKQNINKDILALNNAVDEMDLTSIYKDIHPKEAKYTFFSNAHGPFSKIDHMIGHKASLNKFKKIEIISNIFFWPQGTETRNKSQGKNPNTLKNMEIE